MKYQYVEKDVKPNNFSQSVPQASTDSWLKPAIFEGCLTGADFGVNNNKKSWGHTKIL